MRYGSLTELVKNNSASREYLLSLPIKKQVILHEEFEQYIHSPEDLHSVAASIDTFYRKVSPGDSLNYALGMANVFNEQTE